MYDYDYYASSYARNSVAAEAATAAGMIATMGVIFFVVMIALLIASVVVYIIGLWKIFKKAGREGWEAILPGHNTVVLFQLGGLHPLLSLIIYATAIPLIGWIAAIVILSIASYKLGKAFGKSTGFIVGLILLPPVFYMMLGFGKSTYLGPQNSTTTTTTTTTP